MTFWEIFHSRPDRRGIGSSGFSRLAHLYILCREHEPKLIVESGTWKGNSSYLFRKACPSARIICYDVSFANLKWRDDSITYRECDIESDYRLPTGPGSLIFFDDHVNQERRYHWAKAMGFETLVFDDNVSAAEAKLLKLPPVPTLKMAGIAGRVLPCLGGEKDTYLTVV